MKKLLCMVAAAAVAAPAAAVAADTPATPTTPSNAAQVCKAERTAAGSAEAFRMLVAGRNTTVKVTTKNAYGKCVSAASKKDATQAKAAKTNANAVCKAMPDAQLAAEYGTKANAFGKCVSGKAKAKHAAVDAAEVAKAKKTGNAAKLCKAQGLKGSKFGQCVSTTVKAQNDA